MYVSFDIKVIGLDQKRQASPFLCCFWSGLISKYLTWYSLFTYLIYLVCLFQERPTYDNAFKLEYLDMVVSESLRMHPPASRYDNFDFYIYWLTLFRQTMSDF